jgi:hypothetical protein
MLLTNHRRINFSFLFLSFSRKEPLTPILQELSITQVNVVAWLLQFWVYSWRLQTMIVWVFYHSLLLLLAWSRSPFVSPKVQSHILTWNSLCMCVLSVEIQVWRRLEGMGIMEKWKNWKLQNLVPTSVALATASRYSPGEYSSWSCMYRFPSVTNSQFVVSCS